MRLCALTGKTDVATLLIDAGADVNTKDKDGKTPLMVCSVSKMAVSMFPGKQHAISVQGTCAHTSFFF